MCRLERKRAIHSKSYLRTFLWILNKTIVKVGSITKADTFKSFLHLSFKTITFFVTVLFSIFMMQTLTDNFWGYSKI